MKFKESDFSKQIRAVEDKYGLLPFRMAFQHLFETGKENFTVEAVAEAKAQIAAKDDGKREGKIPVMTPEFQYAILDCAYELARQNTWDLFAYIKVDVHIDGA